jgi:hypothetical protein
MSYTLRDALAATQQSAALHGLLASPIVEKYSTLIAAEYCDCKSPCGICRIGWRCGRAAGR